MKDKFWIIEKGDKKGVIDVKSGLVLVQPKYDMINDILLDGNAIFVIKGYKGYILNYGGEERGKFFYLEPEKVIEYPEAKAVLIKNKNNPHYFLVTKSGGEAIEVDIDKSNFQGFDRTIITAVNEKYLSGMDKREFNKFTSFFPQTYTLNGAVTPYIKGETLGDKLFVMETPASRDLFRIGETKSIGSIKQGVIDFDKDGLLALEEGLFVDKDGNLVEPLYNDDKKLIALKNVTTGKFAILTQDIKNCDFIYDDVQLKDSNRFDFLAKKGDEIFMGVIGKELQKFNPYIQLSKYETKNKDIYTVILTPEGKTGLMRNGKLLISDYYSYYDVLDLDNKTWVSYFIFGKDGYAAMYDPNDEKFIIPFDKKYTYVGKKYSNEYLPEDLYEMDLVYVAKGSDKEGNRAVGLWNLELGREVFAPKQRFEFEISSAGNKPYIIVDGTTYSSTGAKMKIPQEIFAYSSVVLGSVGFDYTIKGMKGRTITFTATVYKSNGSVYRTYNGTPHYIDCDIYSSALGLDGDQLPRSRSKIKLTAKDSKTGASIPIKGRPSIEVEPY